MSTRLIVGGVLVLENGMVAIAGKAASASPLAAGAIGRNSSGSVEVEIVSVGIVDSSAPQTGAEAFLVRVLRGASADLVGCTLDFGDE